MDFLSVASFCLWYGNIKRTYNISKGTYCNWHESRQVAFDHHSKQYIIINDWNLFICQVKFCLLTGYLHGRNDNKFHISNTVDMVNLIY